MSNETLDESIADLAKFRTHQKRIRPAFLIGFSSLLLHGLFHIPALLVLAILAFIWSGFSYIQAKRCLEKNPVNSTLTETDTDKAAIEASSDFSFQNDNVSDNLSFELEGKSIELAFKHKSEDYEEDDVLIANDETLLHAATFLDMRLHIKALTSAMRRQS